MSTRKHGINVRYLYDTVSRLAEGVKNQRVACQITHQDKILAKNNTTVTFTNPMTGKALSSFLRIDSKGKDEFQDCCKLFYVTFFPCFGFPHL